MTSPSPLSSMCVSPLFQPEIFPFFFFFLRHPNPTHLRWIQQVIPCCVHTWTSPGFLWTLNYRRPGRESPQRVPSILLGHLHWHMHVLRSSVHVWKQLNWHACLHTPCQCSNCVFTSQSDIHYWSRDTSLKLASESSSSSVGSYEHSFDKRADGGMYLNMQINH